MKSIALSIVFVSLLSLGFAQEALPKADLTFVYLDKEAHPVNLKKVTDQIEYPAELVLAGIEGRVVYRVLVDKEGNYRKHQLLNSPNDGLTFLADDYLKNLEFTPAVQNGQKVSSWVNIPIVYKIAPAWASR